MRKIIKKYYRLTKPGIVWGNLLAAVAGFAIGSNIGINWLSLILMCTGLGSVIASACIFNNYYDRDIDAKMERTRERALVKRSIASDSALLFATFLGLFGALVLLFFTNISAFSAALLGFVVYVFAYTPLKRRTNLALYIGAVAGATPPMVGYAAASGRLDTMAFALFAIMFFWQLPHFIAISVFRFEEYTAAGVPLVITRALNDKQRRFAKDLFIASLFTLPIAAVGAVLWRLFLA